jgi:hypothetical protein
MNAFASQLITPQVHHLFWCLFSPDLVTIENSQSIKIPFNSQLTQWLTELDRHPDPLFAYLLQANSTLLGGYFECLWQFFFKFNPEWQLLAHNVQVIEKKQTLGELDIIASHQGAAAHLELAVKFYLQHPDHDGQQCQHWLGPQCKDRLDLKLDKLQNKQLPFLAHPATQAAMKRRKLPSPTQQHLILKGYLFSHWKMSFKRPSVVNPNCLMGQWLHQSQLKHLVVGHDNWLIIEKPQWLGHFKNIKGTQGACLTAKEITHITVDHFSNSPYKHALMLVKITDNEKESTESERFLIVNNDWPNI